MESLIDVNYWAAIGQKVSIKRSYSKLFPISLLTCFSMNYKLDGVVLTVRTGKVLVYQMKKTTQYLIIC